MRFTEEEGLQAVRQVFAGSVARHDIGTQMSAEARVYVGVAIMSALPHIYLGKGGVVRGSLKHSLNDLLETGVPRPEHERLPSYAPICKRLGLYQSLPRHTTPQPVRLTPTPALEALVTELGATEAVMTFHLAAAAAIAHKEREIAASRAAHDAKEEALNAQADAMIAYIRAQGGDKLVWAVTDRVHELWRKSRTSGRG